MNAQEAIERMEEELSSVELLMGDYSDESVDTYVEALSIVLESAKRLEKISDEALSYSGIEDLDVNNVELFDFSKWVYDVSKGFEV